MALGAFGAYLGGLGDSDMASAQQNALNQLMNMQASNQSAFGIQGMLNPYHSAQGIGTAIGGLQQYTQQFQQSYPPPPIVEPKQAVKQKLRDEPDDDFRATDYGESDSYFLPAWKRRLMKRYPEGMVIGGFMKRLAMEIDFWHANAAGLPA